MKQTPDGDSFPTEPLKKVTPDPKPKLAPKDDWKQVSPDVYRNGEGKLKTRNF